MLMSFGLHVAFVLLRGLLAAEGSEIAALAGLRIYFPRIEPVFAAPKLADHSNSPRGCVAILGFGARFGGAAPAHGSLRLLDVGQLRAAHGRRRLLAFRDVEARLGDEAVAFEMAGRRAEL